MTAYALSSDNNKECFIYRKDIGAYWGIKGYEETVSEVGTEHGRNHWPQYQFLGTFDAASVRRGISIANARVPSVHEQLRELPRDDVPQIRFPVGPHIRSDRAKQLCGRTLYNPPSASSLQATLLSRMGLPATLHHRPHLLSLLLAGPG